MYADDCVTSDPTPSPTPLAISSGDVLQAEDDAPMFGTPELIGAGAGLVLILIIVWFKKTFCPAMPPDIMDVERGSNDDKIARSIVLQETNVDDTMTIYVHSQPADTIVDVGTFGESSTDPDDPNHHLFYPPSMPPQSMSYDQWAHSFPQIVKEKQSASAMRGRSDCLPRSWCMFQYGNTERYIMTVLIGDTAYPLHHTLQRGSDGVWYLMRHGTNPRKGDAPIAVESAVFIEDVLAEFLAPDGENHYLQYLFGDGQVAPLREGLMPTGDMGRPNPKDKHHCSMFIHRQRVIGSVRAAVATLKAVKAKNSRGYFILLEEKRGYSLCLSTGDSVEVISIQRAVKEGFWVLLHKAKRRSVKVKLPNDTNQLIAFLSSPDKDPQVPPVRLTVGLHRAAITLDKIRWFAVSGPGMTTGRAFAEHPESPQMSGHNIPTHIRAGSPGASYDDDVPVVHARGGPVLTEAAGIDPDALASPAMRPNPRRLQAEQERLDMFHQSMAQKDRATVDAAKEGYLGPGSRPNPRRKEAAVGEEGNWEEDVDHSHAVSDL
jgi:hypothetical protein